MDVAELYMSLIRPNGVPIVGECMADPPFTGQIQVERWSWSLNNDDELKKTADEEKTYNTHKDFLGKQLTRDLQAELLRVNANASTKKTDDAFDKSDAKLAKDISDLRDKARVAKEKNREEIDKQIDALMEQRETAKSEYNKQAREARENLGRSIDKLGDEFAKDIDRRTDEDKRLANEIEGINKKIEKRELENKSWEFSFSKRVDFATTQMLNSMKAGDLFPLAVLTIHQRSSNAGMSLVFTVTDLRLTDYAVRADVGETMTDMKEQWKAEFRSLAYVYKNRKITDGLGSASEAAAKVATQNTVRTFAMKKDLGI